MYLLLWKISRVFSKWYPRLGWPNLNLVRTWGRHEVHNDTSYGTSLLQFISSSLENVVRLGMYYRDLLLTHIYFICCSRRRQADWSGGAGISQKQARISHFPRIGMNLLLRATSSIQKRFSDQRDVWYLEFWIGWGTGHRLPAWLLSN